MIPDLIKRLEEAREGSRELDEAIALAVYPEMERRTVADPITGTEQVWYLHGTRVRIEPYTTSVDAALTLVPEGWRIAEMKDGIKSDRGPYCNTRLWCPANPGLGYAYPGNGATPALALCIAALKAIEAAR
jgi:hypothetical protein